MSGDVSQIATLVAPVVLRYLRARYRALAGDHDDLLQQTLEDMLRYFGALSGPLPPKEQWPAIGVAILKRRIVDRFRQSTARASVSIEEMMDEELMPEDPKAATEEIVQYRRVLATVMRLLSQLSAADQALLLEELDPASAAATSLSSTDRKHLSRLRQRLREQLKNKFGVAPEDIFGI
jgi:DNA-directed RNA polymerase specialized sigma24 family protein